MPLNKETKPKTATVKRCQIECVVYKAEVLNPSSNSNNRNDIKKSVSGFKANPFQTKILQS